MDKSFIKIFYGTGEGKSAAAVGRGVISATLGQRVIIIQFLKGCYEHREMFDRFAPDIEFFRFEKAGVPFAELSEEQKKDEAINIKNGLMFARKVLSTSGCDLLVMDEAIGLVDAGVITSEELLALIDAKADDVSLILTGRELPEQLKDKADNIIRFEVEK